MTQLAPPPKFQVCGVDGLPLVGGRLYTYIAGSSTPKSTYTSYTMSAANTNPVVLDARGEASIWLSGAYRFVLKDATDVLIWDVDDVRDITTSGTLTGTTLDGSLTVNSTAITWSGSPVHSGNHSFSNNVFFNGSVFIGDSTSDNLAIRPSNVVWGTSTTHNGAHTWTGAVTSASTHTFSTAAPTCTFGATFGNVARSGTTVLDWYDEAPTFTAALNFGGNAVGMSTNVTSRATRVGNMCMFSVHIDLVTKGSSTGTMNITGLPYANGGIGVAPCQVFYSAMTGTPGPITAGINVASTSIQLYQHVTPNNLGTALTDTVFANGSQVRVHGFYFV